MNPFTQLIGLTMLVHLFIILANKAAQGMRIVHARMARKRTARVRPSSAL